MDITNLAVPDSTDGDSLSLHEAAVNTRGFRPGLRFKLMFLVILICLVTVLATAYLLYDYQKRQLISNAQSATSLLSNTIEANLQHAMLTQDWSMIDEIVASIVAERSVNSLRILNPQGRVGVSSLPGEVGKEFNRSEPECQFCHHTDPPSDNETVVYSSPAGQQALINVNLILNQPQCQTCHDSRAELLGILLIESPLADLNDQMRMTFWRTTQLALAAITLLVVLILPVLDYFLIRPVKELNRGVAEISAGNLDYQVRVTQSDEVGDLAASFDVMRQQLKVSYTEMELRERELAILNDIGLAATQLLDPQEILEFALDTMVDKLGMADGMAFLKDEATGRFTLRTSRGLTLNQLDEIDRRRRTGWDITAEVAETGREVFVEDMARDERFQGLWENLEGRSYVNLPLISRGMVVGVIGWIAPEGHTLTIRSVEFLKAVGREIGIAVDNALLLADTRRREQQAMTLSGLGTRISASLALREVLDAVADAARELLATEIGLVGLLDEVHGEVLVRAATGFQADCLKREIIQVGDHTPGHALLEGRPVMVDALDSEPAALHSHHVLNQANVNAYLAVPLMRGDQFVGLVEVLSQKPRRFLSHEAQLLTRLANHVVVAVENAHLYRQLHYLATLEERDRLARELHDRLAQTLGYLNVKSSMTDDLLSDGQFDRARESLLELKKVIKIIYTDVREVIFNLRTAVSSRSGLLATLEDYLAEYRAHYDLDVHLVVEDDDTVEFSPEVAGQLLRIIQEALTNVRKHAGARRVWIRCRQEALQERISIEDDGAGFDLAQVAEPGKQSYGLAIMRERAQSVGGTLELISQPGQGTCVVVLAPLLTEE